MIVNIQAGDVINLVTAGGDFDNLMVVETGNNYVTCSGENGIVYYLRMTKRHERSIPERTIPADR